MMAMDIITIQFLERVPGMYRQVGMFCMNNIICKIIISIGDIHMIMYISMFTLMHTLHTYTHKCINIVMQ
jgi:hypothetical protein